MDAAAATALSDADFIAAFEQAELGEFPHRLHLRMAWIYITRHGVDEAIARVRRGIQDLAAARGQTALYHETITLAWVHLVAHAAADVAPECGFDAVVEAHPELLDKRLLLQHYRSAALSSAAARARWVAPDLRPLPGAPAS